MDQHEHSTRACQDHGQDDDINILSGLCHEHRYLSMAKQILFDKLQVIIRFGDKNHLGAKIRHIFLEIENEDNGKMLHMSN